MKFYGNILIALVLASGILWYCSRDNSKPSPDAAAAAKITANQTAQKHEEFFNPDEAIEMIWTVGAQSLHLFKGKDGGWRSGNEKIDTWPVHQRLSLVSKFLVGENIKISKPEGQVTVITAKEKFEGVYDDKFFTWNSPKSAGFILSPDIKITLEEGLLGFKSHVLKVCDQKKLEELQINGSWSIKKEKDKWTSANGNDTSPARSRSVGQFLDRLCTLRVENFVQVSTESPTPLVLALTIFEKNSSAFTISRDDKTFHSIKFGAFKSSELEELLKIPWASVKDFTLDEGATALDPKQTVPERLEAIHKIKASGSVDGIPAMRKLIFEKTDTDVFRFDAVDALVSIGTKEAIDAIAERLQEVGPSGFQTKLARGLGLAVEKPTTFTDKTPTAERQRQIKNVLELYKKKFRNK